MSSSHNFFTRQDGTKITKSALKKLRKLKNVLVNLIPKAEYFFYKFIITLFFYINYELFISDTL